MGLNKGDLGIIFARPEVGKTSFCCYLASEYVKAGHKVFYWANEERATRLKIRMFCSLLNMSKDDLYDNVESCSNKLQDMEVEEKLTVIDSVGTDISEIQSYCDLNKPDIIFIDQLDKIKVRGNFNRGDERLKELYSSAREIAKRNECLVWAVSQAGADAEGKQIISYDMLDGSKTGKAGEGDIIIGIGRNNGDYDLDPTRFLTISKNKVNGVHSTVTCEMDVKTGVFKDFAE
jgi:replicative DNA helicase